MNRTIRAILGAVLILIIVFSGISICQNLGSRLKVDITQQGLYTLSPGTKAILGRLNQPIKAKLYYAKTAARKAPDQIRFFNNYYEFVKDLLEEYVAASKGMVELEVIDPRPFSPEEEQAMKYGLQRFPLSEEESFFFGLVVQTQFGVEKTIPFFAPDRHNFVEYDISYLIDTAITKQKKRIGIMSSLPVMGQDTSDYMARMMQMQGQRPEPPWGIVQQLRSKYEVTTVPTDINDVEDINNVDVLLVIHPKNLSERTRFAIDQFVLNGGRTIVCVDPFCIMDRPQRNPMQFTQQDQSSDLPRLLKAWGLDMPPNTFAGDRALALEAAISRNQRPEKIIGYLDLKSGCFDKDSVITTDLNQVRMLFAGALNEVNPSPPAAAGKKGEPNQPQEKKADAAPALRRTPLVMTTNRGNTWKVSSPFELMYPDPAKLLSSFTDGSQPVKMGYLVTGKFKSSFPEGIEVEVASKDPNEKDDKDPNKPKMVKEHITGLTEAKEEGAVVVFSDVDFISDQMAYANSIFGKMVVGDNSALLMNAIEDLSGSGDLISIRSRGNFKRPFVVVDKIEQEADKETATEVEVVNAQIEGFNQKLQALVSSAKDEKQQELVGSEIVRQKRDLEVKIREAQRQLREIKAKRRARTDRLATKLEVVNMAAVPGLVMVLAIALSVWRGARRRHYISHASDA
jgi:ABC-2 type transport system permease protein